MNKMTKEKVLGMNHFLTAGDLIKFIQENQIPMNAPVMIQRVEDVYYEEHGWGSYLKKGEHYWNADSLNNNMKEEIDRRARGEEAEYPRIKDPIDFMTELEDDRLMEQYHPAWCCVGYKDDTDMLFIDLHY